jgi:hypothetical protein
VRPSWGISAPADENRHHGFIIDTAVTAASGTAERDAAIGMLGELPLTARRLTALAAKPESFTCLI